MAVLAKELKGSRKRTRNSMVAAVFSAHATVAVAIEAGHGFLGEEGEGLFEDC